MKKTLIIFLLITATLSACRFDNEEELYGIDDCDTSEVSFSKDIFPILQTRCSTLGCHVQGGGSAVLFENYTQVKSKVDDGKLKQRVIIQKDMPPGQPLSACQIKFIEKWLEIGAPDN